MHFPKQKAFGFNQKTVIVFMALIIAMYAIFSFLYYRQIKNVFTQQAATQLDSLATIQKSRTEDYIADNMNSLEVILRSNQLASLVSTFTSNPAAMQVSPAKINPSQIALNQFLNDARFERTGVRTISVISTSGIVVASTDQSQIGLNVSQQPYFAKGQAGADVSTFFKGTNGFKGLYLTGPIIYDGQHIGVVVMEQDAEQVFSLFNDNTGLGSTGQWTLVVRNANGDALTVVPGRFGDPNSALEGTVSKSDTTAPVIRALNGQEGVAWDSPDSKGVLVISATRYISETGWGIALKIPEAEVYQPLTQLRNFLIMIGVLLAALFVVFILNALRARYVLNQPQNKG